MVRHNHMRPSTMLWISSTLIGAIVVLALVMMHLQEIDTALPWALKIIGGGAGLAVLYILYNVWHKVSTKQLERKVLAQQITRNAEEVRRAEDAQRNAYALDMARIELERERINAEHTRLMFAATMASQAHVLNAGQTLVRVDESNNYLPYNAPAAQIAQSRQQIEVNTDETIIPSAPKFNEMSHLITIERAPLCYGIDGPIYGTVLDLLSMAVSGKPGRGKTTALMYYVAFLLKCGAEVWIFDPHGSMNALSALNGQVLENMPSTAKVVYLDREQDMVNAVPVLMGELIARDEYYRPAHETKHPLLILADELPVLAEFDIDILADWKQEDKEERSAQPATFARLFKYFVLQARKWNCYFIGSGQTFDAETLPKKITDSMNSRLVFFSSDMRARMSGLENDAIKNLLPAIRRAGPGVMIFDCSRFDAPVIGVIPELNIEDLMAFLGVRIVNALPNAVRPEIKPVDTPFVTRTEDFLEGPDTPESIETVRITSALQTPSESHLEPTHRVVDERTYERAYTMDEATAERFAMAYDILGNIDQALQKAGSNTRYRVHAREIIKARGLKKEGTR